MSLWGVLGQGEQSQAISALEELTPTPPLRAVTCWRRCKLNADGERAFNGWGEEEVEHSQKQQHFQIHLQDLSEGRKAQHVAKVQKGQKVQGVQMSINSTEVGGVQELVRLERTDPGQALPARARSIGYKVRGLKLTLVFSYKSLFFRLVYYRRISAKTIKKY